MIFLMGIPNSQRKQMSSFATLTSTFNKENAQQMAILTRKSKIFIKVNLILLKSCLLGLGSLMICRNLRDVPT